MMDSTTELEDMAATVYGECAVGKDCFKVDSSLALNACGMLTMVIFIHTYLFTLITEFHYL